MWRSLALALVLMSPLAAPAQSPILQPPNTGTPPTTTATPGAAAPSVNTGIPGPEAERPAAAMVWGVAILGTLLILSIVCMPSRKG